MGAPLPGCSTKEPEARYLLAFFNAEFEQLQLPQPPPLPRCRSQALRAKSNTTVSTMPTTAHCCQSRPSEVKAELIIVL